MKIKTVYIHPSIPIRSVDWIAYDEDTYDGPGCLVGYGETEEKAIQDLRDQLEDREEDKS